MKTHWKKLQNPDYLGAYSLDDGNGKYIVIVATIASAKVENIVGADGKREDCVVMRFQEKRVGTVDMKPMIVNTTNMKTLEKLFKTPYIEDWAGRRISVGVESVKAFGDVVDALRIKKTLPQGTGPATCADCGEEIKAIQSEKGPLNSAQLIAISRKKYGADLCADCMKKREAAKKETAEPETARETEDNADAINE